MRTAIQPKILFLPVILFAATSATADRQPITEALSWIRVTPRNMVQYDYVMTARVRLLFFWASKDDVGGGYIRRGVSAQDPHQELFQVLFGSDPAKAPRAINRWGAGTEVAWHRELATGGAFNEDDVIASAFFGFMKSSHGASATEMQQELKREKERGEHAFTGILSRVESNRAYSVIVPLLSDTDYNLRQYEVAEPVMFERIGNSDRPVRSLEDTDRCPRASEFLGTFAELLDRAITGQAAPLSRCYVYDSQENTLTLERIEAVAKLPVQLHGPKGVILLENSYENVQQADFVSTHKLTGKQVHFTILVGTEGPLRGVPVQIRYEPNWWFQVVLNLRPNNVVSQPPSLAAR